MIRLLIFLVIPVCIVLLAFRQDPLIEQDSAFEFVDIAEARDALSRIRNAISTPGLIAVELRDTELTALSNSMSDLESGTHFLFSIDGNVLRLQGQVAVSRFSNNYYLTATCDLHDESVGISFDYCQIGHLVIPGTLARFILGQAIRIGLSDEHKAFFDNLIKGASVGNQRIAIVAEKPLELESIQGDDSMLHETLAKAWFATQFVDQTAVETYVLYLNSLQYSDASLSNWMFRAFELAQQVPNNLTPEEENQAALWAMAILFGDPRFTQFVAEKNTFAWATFKPATLGKRRDLAQHFLFSAVLYLVGNAEIALSVGQIKEFSDSLSGGSGYSFADLAADKAGLKFAEVATKSEQGARTIQCLLNGQADENLFFPSIRGLPEGIRDADFKARYGDQNTPQYAVMESMIDQRIDVLPVHQESYLRLCGNG